MREALTRFRVDAARTLGLVPDAVDDAALAEIDRAAEGQLSEAAATALRRAVFEQPELRAARDGMAAARDLLQRGIPALFAAAPPADLAERLLKQATPRRPNKPPRGLGWARAGLALGVLALAAAIVLVPSWLSRRPAPTAVRAPSAAELIDSAIHRFDRAPLEQGVLHEQYRVAAGARPAYLIERWYDYASPHRLAVSSSLEGRSGRPTLQISSDGRSLIQYRYGDRSRNRPVDAHVSEAEAQSALAVLRGEPSADPFTRARTGPVDIAPLYLAQARAAGATFLGQTRLLDRPAFLLAYRAERLPATPGQPALDQPSQVILTIDAQTFALLEIAVVADGAGESSALRPLQAQIFEVLPSVAESTWQLPTTARVEQRAGLPSARAPEIPSALVIDLDDALRRAQHPMFAPLQLPIEPMRALALPLNDGGAEHMALLYESEFQSFLLRPLDRGSADIAAGREERSAGDFRYRVIDLDEQQSSVAAVVYRPEAPDDTMLIMLVDPLATTGEHEAALGQLVGSLTPVTEQNLPALRRSFYRSSAAGGQE